MGMRRSKCKIHLWKGGREKDEESEIYRRQERGMALRFPAKICQAWV